MQIISKHTRGRNYTIKRKGGKRKSTKYHTRKHKGGKLFSSLTSLFGAKKDPISVQVNPIETPANVQVARERAMMQAAKSQAERENLANIRGAARERAMMQAAKSQAERVKKANESAARIEAIRQKTKRNNKNLKHIAESRIKTAKKRNLKGGFEPEEVRRSLNDGGWADVIARNIVQQRIDGHLEDLAVKREADSEYISGSKADIHMKGRYRSLHRNGCSVELLKTKKAGSDSPDRKDDPDYLKVFVVGNNPTDYQGDSGEYFVKHNPFIEGDKLYIRDLFYNPNKQNPKDDGQLLGTITKLGQRFFPYTELQDVQKYNSRFYNVRKMEDGTYEPDFHFSLRYEETPEIVAEREKQTKAGGPGIYALEITYKNNGQPLVNPLLRGSPLERGDYRGMADSSNPACLYTKDADRERKMPGPPAFVCFSLSATISGVSSYLSEK